MARTKLAARQSTDAYFSNEQFLPTASGSEGDPFRLSDEFIASISGGSTTPAAPTVIADDEANTLKFTHALGSDQLIYSITDGPYVPGDEIAGWDAVNEQFDMGDNERA